MTSRALPFAPHFALIAALTLAGCAHETNQTADAYTREQARQEMVVRTGVVQSLRDVTMEGTKSGVGGFAGSAIGGVIGSNFGGGQGHIIGAIIGAVLGGLAGNAMEEGATTKPAKEITVRLSNGQTIAIVQEAAADEFRVGDAVRVLSGAGGSRVSR